jgi:hypothetical protein
MAGLVPATPLNEGRLCHMIGVAGTSPAMTVDWETGTANSDKDHAPIVCLRILL